MWRIHVGGGRSARGTSSMVAMTMAGTGKAMSLTMSMLPCDSICNWLKRLKLAETDGNWLKFAGDLRWHGAQPVESGIGSGAGIPAI